MRDAVVRAQFEQPVDVKPALDGNSADVSFGESQSSKNNRNPFQESHSPLHSPQSWESSPLANAIRRSRDSCDQSCDLQFINGRLMTVDSAQSSAHELVCQDSVKQELPEQDEPEDLSMKTTLKDCFPRSNNVFGTVNETYKSCIYNGYGRDISEFMESQRGNLIESHRRNMQEPQRQEPLESQRGGMLEFQQNFMESGENEQGVSPDMYR